MKISTGQTSFSGGGASNKLYYACVLCRLASAAFWLSLVKSHLCILNLLSKWHFSLGSCKTNKCESTVCNCPSFPCSTLTYHPVCNWNASIWLLSGANVTVNAIMPYYPMSAAYCTAMYRCFYTEWFSSYRVYKTIETIWSVFKPAKDKGTEKQSIG